MAIPSVNGTVQDGGLGANGGQGTNTIVLVGTATAGPLGSNGGANGGPGFTTATSKRQAVANYTSGPLVELACYLLDITPSPPTVLMYRTPNSTAATIGTPDLSSWTGTAVPSWTGTPLDSEEQYVTVATGGIVGTTGITLTDSWDNSRTTEPGPIPLGTLSTYVPAGSGVVLHLDPPSAALYTSVNALRTAVLAHIIDIAGSPAIHLAADTADQAALAAIPAATTYSTTIALYNGILTYFAVHVASTVYHTTADAVAEAALAALTPAVYAIDVVMGLPTLIAIYNAHRVLVGAGPVHGSADSTNVCAASTATGGTVNAGDSIYTAMTEAMPIATDVTTAIATITNGLQRFRGMVVTGTIGPSEFTTIDAATPTFEAAYDWSFVLCNTVDYTTGQTDPQYVTAMQSAWSNTFAQDKRIALADGFAKITAAPGAPNSGRQIRRPFAWAVARRYMENDPSVDVSEFDLGALKDVSITDANGNPTEHDERVNGGLGGLTDAPRLISACTFKGYPGTYICVPWMKSPVGSDYIRIHLRAVMDLACVQVYQDLLLLLNKGVAVNPKTGFLDPLKANTLGFHLNADLKSLLLAPQGALQRPRASGGGFKNGSSFVSVATTDNLLVPGTPLNVAVSIVPLAYLETIDFQIAFTNPALAAQQGG